MIIKLQAASTTYARHKEEKIVKPLTKADRVKGDRLVMLFLFLITIIGAVIFA